MEEKYVWPLVGVFLGWVLTALSANFKSRSDKKKLVGNLLTKLIRVERQLGQVISATDRIKDYPGSWKEYEAIRQGIVRRHFLEPESVRDDLKKAIDNVAPFYPVLAIDLENTYELVVKNKDASLSTSSENEEAYIRILSLYEVGLDICKKDLSQSIKNIAFKHGILTYLKIRYVNYTRAKNKKNSEQFVSTFSSELMQELNATHNKSSNSDADLAPIKRTPKSN